MSRYDQNWQKLVALARQAPTAADDIVLPPGFATRLAALAVERTIPSPWGGFERLALRGFVTAATCCAAVVAYSYFGQTSDFSEELALDDAVAMVMELH